MHAAVAFVVAEIGPALKEARYGTGSASRSGVEEAGGGGLGDEGGEEGGEGVLKAATASAAAAHVFKSLLGTGLVD